MGLVVSNSIPWECLEMLHRRIGGESSTGVPERGYRRTGRKGSSSKRDVTAESGKLNKKTKKVRRRPKLTGWFA
jgi:hypothetical protein